MQLQESTRPGIAGATKCPVRPNSPSIGTIADSFDSSMAETTNRLSAQAECVFGPDAWRRWTDADELELELATLSWVHRFDEQRLNGNCGDIPPAEFEAAHYAAQQAAPIRVGNQ